VRLTLTTILILLFFGQASNAQKLKISLSGKHLKKVEKISKPSKKLLKYRKLYKKDSTKFKKDQEKVASKKLDSLSKGFKIYAKKGVMDTLQFPEEYRKYLSESMLDSGVAQNQGMAYAKTEGGKWLKENPEYKEYQKMLKENPELAKWVNKYGNSPGALKDMPDSVFTFENGAKSLESYAEKQLGKRGEMKYFNEQTEASKSFTDMPNQYKAMGEGYKKQGEQYADKDYLKEKGKEEALARSMKLAAAFLANNKELSGVQKQMTKLKKKYSSLANSGDLSSGVKRNSLEGRPWDERFVFGGNFDVQVGEPIKVDLSPIIGYKVIKPLTLGVGATYRLDIGYDPKAKLAQYDNQVYGYNAYISYDIIKQFFAYAEMDYMAGVKSDTLTDDKTTVWQPAVAAGIGRSFKVHAKVTGTVMLLYHVVNSPIKNPSGNPFQVKFGFQTNALTFKKIKKPF